MFGYTHIFLFFLAVFQCNAVPSQSSKPSEASLYLGIPQRYLDCTMDVQLRTGSNGFGTSYQKGNRANYGPVPSKNKPIYVPADLDGKVTIEVETLNDYSHGGSYIMYKLWVQNTDIIVRHGQLAWFTPGLNGVLPKDPDYLFTVTANPNQGVQGCLILTRASAQKSLTYQAW